MKAALIEILLILFMLAIVICSLPFVLIGGVAMHYRRQKWGS